MYYRFKGWQELAWSVALVAAGTLLTHVAGIDEGKIGDRAWWLMVGLSVGRAMAGYLLSLIPRSFRAERVA